jgi:hypothetical protein
MTEHERKAGPAAGSGGSDQSNRYASGRRDPEASKPGTEHPPHVTANDDDAPVQDELDSKKDVPVLPANAAGEDQVSTDDQPREIDPESAYDRRPEEDKGWTAEEG